jgi:hypothetical protein
MIGGILDRALPWGAFVALGALVGAAFPGETRAAAKRLVLASMRASDLAREFGAEAYEKSQDVVAEARLEYEKAAQEAERDAQRRSLRVVSSRRRRTSSRPAARRASRPRPRQGQEATTP